MAARLSSLFRPYWVKSRANASQLASPLRPGPVGVGADLQLRSGPPGRLLQL